MQVRRRKMEVVEEEEPEVDEEQERKDQIDSQIRTHKALQHMEMLQLPSAKVMPVLLQLVKAYDGKWEFIEADNYHVLVDTFFSMQESEGPGSSSAGGSRKKQKKAIPAAGRVTKRRLKKQAESEDSDEDDGSHELVHRIRARAPTIVASRPEAKRKAPVDEEEDEEYYPQPLLSLPPPPPQGYGLSERASKETQTEPESSPSNALVCYQEDESIEILPILVKEEESQKNSASVKEEKESSSKMEVPYLSDFEARRELFSRREICKTCDKPLPTFDPSIVKVEPPSREGMTCFNAQPLLAIEAPVEAPAPDALMATEAPAEVPPLIGIEPLLLTYRNTSSMAEPDPCLLEKLAVQEPGLGEPAVEEAAVEEPAVEEAALAEPAIEEAAVEEAALTEPAIEEPAVEEAANSNSNANGALAALASYSSGSDRSKEAEVDQAKAIADQGKEAEVDAHEVLATPTAHVGAGVPSRSTTSSEMRRKGKQAASGIGTTSSNSSMRRRLVKVKDDEEEEQSVPTIRSRHDAHDISRGKEKVPITLARDKAGKEDLPAEFFYITASVVYQSAHVGISVARISEVDRCSSCMGNCLDRSVPCECARLSSGVFAYTVEGCLYPHYLEEEIERKREFQKFLSYCPAGACPIERSTDENCKGHIQRRFIKECWEKCGCTQSCGNRVVQRGIAHRLQVFWAGSAKGWGLRTLEALRAGAFVCEYIGEILTNTEMWNRNNDEHNKEAHFFSLQLDADWCSEKFLKDEEALCLDGTKLGNVARFINHRCDDPNLIDIPVEIESPDHHYYHLAFFTRRDVKANEELTWDYGLDFNDKDHQVRAFECACGSSFCRGKQQGAPWV